MKLIVLGSGPSIAIPRKNCCCLSCRQARGLLNKSRRTRSSLFFSAGDKNILIDAGPDFLKQAAREKIKSIDAVFITHGHADAAGGLKKLDRWLREKKATKTIPFFVEKITWRRMIKKFKTFKNFREVFIKPGQAIDLWKLPVRAFRVGHSMTPGFPALGFRFGDFFVYASDVSFAPQKSLKYFSEVDTVFLDGAMYFGKSIKSHFNTAQALKFISGFKGIKRVYLTQLGHTYPPHEQAEKAVKKYWREIRGATATKVGLAFDGMRVLI